MLRSNACFKNIHQEAMEEDCWCFCSSCVPDATFPDPAFDDDHPRVRHRVAAFMVYPDYGYVRPPKVSDEVAATEQLFHEYLARIGRIPKPFKKDLLAKHRPLLESAISDGDVAPIRFDTGPEILEKVAAAAKSSEHLVLVMCGHGRPQDGALLVADNTAVSMRAVGDALRKAKFRGTAFVCYVCYAEAGTEDASGLGDDADFGWVVLYSCGHEKQATTHALHVTNTVARILQERPRLADLQQRVDQLWVETRDPQEPARLWRGPPNLRVRRGMPGDVRIMA